MKNHQLVCRKSIYRTRSTSMFAMCVLAVVVIFQLIASNVHASLIVIGAPPSTLPGTLISSTDVFFFYESSTTLGAPLPVDIIAPGLYNLADPDNPGAIPANTTINSYLLHHDSLGILPNTLVVSVTFPQPVLGIIINDANLDASDPILKNPGTLYPTGLAYRGLELPYSALNDVVFWSGNQVFVAVKSTTALAIDQIRVVTAVPEPSTIVLATIAAPIAWLIRKRRR